MMSLHIGHVLMQQKMVSFHEQSGGASSSWEIVQHSEIGEIFQVHAFIATREGTFLSQNEIL